MLHDILFSTQLLITHFVTTFSSNDNHDILGIYLVCGLKQHNEHAFSSVWFDSVSGQTEWETMLILFLGITRTHRISIAMITDWKYYDQVTDQELVAHNVTKHVWVHESKHVNCMSLTSDHHSRARDADIILFQPQFVMTMSVTFCRFDLQ